MLFPDRVPYLVGQQSWHCLQRICSFKRAEFKDMETSIRIFQIQVYQNHCLNYSLLKLNQKWGPWVAHSVEHLTLGFSSGHDLMVRGLEPSMGLCAEGSEPAWDSLSPPPLLTHCLKINKLFKK